MNCLPMWSKSVTWRYALTCNITSWKKSKRLCIRWRLRIESVMIEQRGKSLRCEVEMDGKKLRLMILTHGSHKAAAIIERIVDLPCVEIAGIFIETVQGRRLRLSEKLKRSIRYDGFG